MGNRENIDWDATELVNQLGTKGAVTRSTCELAFKAYFEYTDMSPKELIDDVKKEYEGSRRERGRTKKRILGFRKWLLEEL